MHLLLLALLAASGTAIAQLADRRFDVRGFDAVDLASSYTVLIVPGAAFSVTAELATPTRAVDLGRSGSVSAAAFSAANIKAGSSGSVRVPSHPACAVTKSGTARVTCG